MFLVEMGFYHVGQADLGLLASNGLPALAFQSAGITGVSHHARLKLLFLDKALPHVSIAPRFKNLMVLHWTTTLYKLQGLDYRIHENSQVFFFFLFFLRQGLMLSHKLKCSGIIMVHCSLNNPGSS